MRRWTVLCGVLALAGSSALLAPGQEPAPRFALRWFYSGHNLLRDGDADELVALVRRAAGSGYNGLVLGDYKLDGLGEQPPRYFRNVERVREAAAAAGIEIVPRVASVGYSNGLLAHDPNLAEGLPVVDAPFVVRRGEAVPASGPVAHLVNGDLEDVRGDRFAGFSLQDDPGETTVADRRVAHQGHVSCRMQNVLRYNPTGNCRLGQVVKVRPHTCYRFSCWVKTEGLRPTSRFRLLVIGTDKRKQRLTFSDLRLEATQDWTHVGVLFNSLGETEVHVYAGQWLRPSDTEAGTLWLDDLELEEPGLVNVLRRPGCPLVVTSADGRTRYEEGQDFLPVRDASLGRVPSPGKYDPVHEAPTIRLTPHSRVREGETLLVSWYHPILTGDSSVACCLCDAKVDDLIRDQVRRVNELLRPKTFFLSHDELRVVGWCRDCRAQRRTPGELLAANVRRCVASIRAVNPQADVVIWSDMFDPYHNAHDDYFLVNGPLEGSWKGLPPEVIVVNWNSKKAAASLKWFADLGHPQVLAGYYDENLDNLRAWTAAARGIPGVRGFLYTTWHNKYDELEAFGRTMSGKE